jgi:hypothetical protein
VNWDDQVVPALRKRESNPLRLSVKSKRGPYTSVLTPSFTST